MHLAAASLALVIAVLCPPSGGDTGPAAAAGVMLNEFVAGPARDWNGSGAVSTRDDEWVEIFNGGGTAVDLSSFLLTDSDRVPRCGFTGTLEAGGRLLVFGSDSYAWEKAQGYPAYGLSLGNSGDAVMLWQVSGTDTVLVDSYEYQSHEAAADRAVGRRVDGGAWVLLDGLNPYTGTTAPPGTGCSPTPGAANLCEDTPAVPTTWGRIKTLYTH